MTTTNRVIIALLQALVREWRENHSVEEIACSDEKITLLVEVLKLKPADVPADVKQLYQEVFLRDVWDENAGGPEPY